MSKKLTVTTLLFDDFELLDVFGPLEMFGISNMMKDGFELKFVSETGTATKSSAGPVSVVDYSFSDEVPSDILLIPGGMGTRVQIENNNLITWLSKQSKKAKIVASVCTGSALLARSGIIDNMPATTNKMAFEWVSSINSKVNWQPCARWVQAGSIYTSSGVSAGMDMALAMIANIYDQETAEQVANGAEYDWHKDASYDPFSKIYGLS